MRNSTDEARVLKTYSRFMLNLLTAAPAFVLNSFACLLIADLCAGLLHWAEDTWLAPGHNALLDRWVVEPNIEHHRRPGAIRQGTYWETNGVTIAIAGAIAAILAACGVHAWEAYLTVFIGSQSNQLHAWAHTSNPPRLVAWLRNVHLLQSAAEHALHHRRPYGIRYCTTTNLLNPLLDGIGFWRALEWLACQLGAKVYRATPARAGY